MTDKSTLISIIVPIYNGCKWIDSCFQSFLNQTCIGYLNLEICICNDGSTDDTKILLEKWQLKFHEIGIPVKIFSNCGKPGGVGYAKNRAVAVSSGEFLCFQDIDDIMLPDRILRQHEELINHEQNINLIIGCRFEREPKNSTNRYTKWANELSQEQLNIQVFTSHGPTVIMPTWFCYRTVFDKVGGFVEGHGIPEDLIFFYKHLDLGGKIARSDDCLLIYTYHPSQTTFQINQRNIWNLRIERLERIILINWQKFTIWNAGKQGRKFYNSLSAENKKKVTVFCDVDRNKIGKKYQYFDPRIKKNMKAVDIVHYKAAEPPFVICIKMDLTDGKFEENLAELNLTEGKDYIMFS